MATKKKGAKSEKNDKPMFDVKGMRVKNVRRLSDSVIAFSLLGNGLGLYNLKVIDGSKGEFIATPQTKGRDGEWYNQYALYLSDGDAKKIIKRVNEAIDEEDDEEDDIPF